MGQLWFVGYVLQSPSLMNHCRKGLATCRCCFWVGQDWFANILGRLCWKACIQPQDPTWGLAALFVIQTDLFPSLQRSKNIWSVWWLYASRRFKETQNTGGGRTRRRGCCESKEVQSGDERSVAVSVHRAGGFHIYSHHPPWVFSLGATQNPTKQQNPQAPFMDWYHTAVNWL